MHNPRSLALLIVLSGLIISIAMGMRQSLGLFMGPMQAAFGISAAAFGFAIALQNIILGVAQPFVGALADKHGARPVVIGSALLFAAGMVLMAFPRTVPAGLEIGGVLIGIGTAGCGLGPLIGAITRATTPERRSQTVGIVAAGGSIGTFVLAPTGQVMIDSFGWQGALFGFALFAVSMALFALPIRESQSPIETRKIPLGEAVREATSHRGYLFMTLAFFACGFQLVFITTHLPRYLQICGVAPGVSATALGLIGLFNAVGTYCFGLLGARYSQRKLLAMIYLLRTLFIIAFLAAPISPASTLVFASAMGFLWLGVAPLVSGIVARVFGLTHFNTLYGIVFLSHQVGSFFGAWMGGVVVDWRGTYDLAWAALIAIGLTAFTLQWLMDERPPRQPVGAAAVPA